MAHRRHRRRRAPAGAYARGKRIARRMVRSSTGRFIRKRR